MGNRSELTAGVFLRKLIGFSMASWFGAGISFLATPILTRLYLPEELGTVNMFVTYMTFFQTVCVMALDQAFMRFYNENLEGLKKTNILTYCLYFNFGMAVLSSAVILIGHSHFSMQISGNSDFFVSVCLIVVVFSSSFLRMSSVSSRMEKNVVQYTLQVVLISVVEKVLFIVAVFVYGANYRSAIFTMTIGYLVLAIAFFLLKRKKALAPVTCVPIGTTKIVLGFAIPYLPVLILSWLNSSIPLLVLNYYVDKASIGIYTNAVTISNILSIIQTGFTTYWGPFVYEHYKEEESQIKIQKIQRCAVLVLTMFALSIVLFQDIVYLLIGEKYRASKLFFPFLILGPFCNCIGDMMGIGIMLSKKSYLNIFTFLGSVGTNLALAYYLIPKVGVAGAGVAAGAASLVMLFLRSALGMRYYNPNKSVIFLVISVASIVVACGINILCSEQIGVRSGLLVALILLNFIYFHKELRYILLVGRQALNTLFAKCFSKK